MDGKSETTNISRVVSSLDWEINGKLIVETQARNDWRHWDVFVIYWTWKLGRELDLRLNEIVYGFWLVKWKFGHLKKFILE